MAEELHKEELPAKKYRWEESDPTAASTLPSSTRWSSATPRQYGGETPRMSAGLAGAQSTWRGMATPSTAGYTADRAAHAGGATPSFAGSQTPTMAATPMFTGATPAAGSAFGATPNYQFEGTTPAQSRFAAAENRSATTAAIEAKAKQLEREWRAKNRRLTAETLDAILPSEFFTIAPVPPDYNPPPPEEPNFYEEALKSADWLAAESASAEAAAGPVTYDIPESLGDDMPPMKPEDAPIFVELLKFHGVDPIPEESLPSYLLMRHLFKLKNGDPAQRRSGTRYLLDKARVFGSSVIFQRVFRIWSAGTTTPEEKHHFLDFIKALIARMGKEVRGSTKEVVQLMEPLLSAPEPIIREGGRQVLVLLTRLVGFAGVFSAIKEDFAHDENVVRRQTAKVIAIVGYAVGPTELMQALQDMSYAPTAFARQTVARSLGELASLLGHAIVAVLPDMVPIFERLIRDEKRVRRDAATAVAFVAEASAPYGIEQLAPLVDVICDECKQGIGSTAGPFLRAFGALVPLMAPYDAQARTAAMMPTLVNQFNTPEDEYRWVLLTVVRQCVSAEGVTPLFIRDLILEPFFEGFWRVRRVAANHKVARTLIATTVEIAKKVGSAEILLKLAPEMKDDNEQYQRMVIEAVRRVVEAAGTDAVADSLIAFLLDGSIAAVRQDETGTNRVVMEGLAALCVSLGSRLKPYLKSIFDLIHRRRESSDAPQRMQAAELIRRIAHTVIVADGTVFLQDLGRSLYERLEDDDANALSANLRASRAILAELGSRRYKPSVRELLKKLTFVIRNRNSNVQQATILLIEDIATHHEADVDALHLHELATKGLFELLDADRRETRRACTRTFGVIAQKIRPFSIVLELVDNFRQDKRKIRICTAVALGSIARACGPFTVVPYLLNEYRISEGEQVAVIVQHSILKAIRYIFEFIGSAGLDYAYPLVPLLERALTETSLPMRRMAVEASRAVIMAVAGHDGFEDLTVHLLNFTHPNIVELLSKNEVRISEERLKMVTAVVSFYEAARLVVGSGTLLRYLLQGLFHPAAKVRDIYRRTYNVVYYGNPEGMVPFYPAVEDDAAHTYTRYELLVPM